MDTPGPTRALLASFHSGRWVFIQMPASGMKLASLASATSSSFSVRVARVGPSLPMSSLPSAPSSWAKAMAWLWPSWSKVMVWRGSVSRSS